MSSSSLLASQMRKTADAFVDAYSAWTTEAVMAVRGPRCEQVILPSSLGVPTRDNERYRAYFDTVQDRLSNVKMTMHDYFASVEDRRAAVHATMEAEAVTGPYSNEYVFLLSFDESGEKLVKVVEMLDSAAAKEVRERMRIAGFGPQPEGQ